LQGQRLANLPRRLEVIESLEKHEILSSDIEKQFEKKLTFGEHLQTASPSSAAVGNSSLHLALLSSCGSVRTSRCSLPEFDPYRSSSQSDSLLSRRQAPVN
jgi:hypothetical protein